MALHNLEKYDVILASNSPRRKELLAQLDVPFRVQVLKDIDESYPADLPVASVPLYLSQKKAEGHKSLIKSNEMIITADTIVLLGDEVMGKPADEAEAMAMLSRLSGKTHKVITGVSIVTAERCSSFETVTDVTFNSLSTEEIDYYVKHYRPLDKAGAYGIQEWIGAVAVSNITGSFYNVIGLPVQRLYEELKRF